MISAGLFVLGGRALGSQPDILFENSRPERLWDGTISHPKKTSTMFFTKNESDPLYVSRSDDDNPLSSYSAHVFHLEDADWPTVEHYYQGMKFEDLDQREAIRNCSSPDEAAKLAWKHAGAVRKDWKAVRETIMTRGMYIQCRTHPAVAQALLETGEQKIVETSQFDYYWGCGRDGRGHNTYGKLLMAVRDKLKAEQ